MTAMRKRALRALGMALILISLGIYGAPALRAATGGEEHVKASLLSEVSAIRPGQPFWVALRMKMDPHWHTYWINPGDSGLGTTMKWALPEGFSAGPIQWPYPQRIDVSGLISFAYEGEIYLLQQIHPPAGLKAGETVKLGLQADWLVCAEICVPGEAKLELSLPVKNDGAQDDAVQADFARARSMLPVTAQAAGIGAVPRIDGERLVISVKTPPPGGKIFFFPEASGIVAPSATQTVSQTPEGFDLSVALEEKRAVLPANFRGILVAESGWPSGVKAIEISLPGGEEAPAQAPSWDWKQFLFTALSAFAAGLILNLMPCVFPVLSIKVLGFVRQSESHPDEVKRQGLLFGAGVLLSFLLLAGLFLLLRGTGESLGWAFQFQSPAFVVSLVFLFFLMGLNLMGVFEIGTSLVGLGAASQGQGGRWEAFASGVLATIVATPCSGPFMGTALGFAVHLPPALGLLIFLSLGLGMALPYVLLSFYPALARKLPKPGPWMESFKQSMAFPLFVTVVWLFWILGSQIEFDGIIALLLALILAGIGVWIYGRWDSPARTEGVRWTARVLALAFLAAGFWHAYGNLQPLRAETEKAGAETDAYGQVWEKYSPELIEKLRAEGRPIYVDFTARWCASCQVNKKLVFGSKEVRDRIKELDMALVKGDWTNNDPVITKALESFGRAAVPFNVIYPKGADAKPMVLPELLTAGIVLEAMKGL